MVKPAYLALGIFLLAALTCPAEAKDAELDVFRGPEVESQLAASAVCGTGRISLEERVADCERVYERNHAFLIGVRLPRRSSSSVWIVASNSYPHHDHCTSEFDSCEFYELAISTSGGTKCWARLEPGHGSQNPLLCDGPIGDVGPALNLCAATRGEVKVSMGIPKGLNPDAASYGPHAVMGCPVTNYLRTWGEAVWDVFTSGRNGSGSRAPCPAS